MMLVNLRKLATLWLLTLVALFALLASSGCYWQYDHPKPTRPKGMPFPSRVRPGIRTTPLNEARCLGGGIGGCSLGGTKAYGGPTN